MSVATDRTKLHRLLERQEGAHATTCQLGCDSEAKVVYAASSIHQQCQCHGGTGHLWTVVSASTESQSLLDKVLEQNVEPLFYFAGPLSDRTAPPVKGQFVAYETGNDTLYAEVTGKVVNNTYQVRPVLRAQVIKRISTVTAKPLKSKMKASNTAERFLECIERSDEVATPTRPKTLSNGAMSTEVVLAFQLFNCHTPVDNLVMAPTWASIAKQWDDSEAVFAMFYSALDADHRGRQVLWLHGDQGNEGKSIVLNSLLRIMGRDTAFVMQKSAYRGKSNFGLHELATKRVILLPDCADEQLLSNSIIKNITGNDPIVVEQKYQSAFTVHGPWRMFITSNTMPVVRHQYETTRLLLVSMSPMVGYISNLEQKLVDEGEAMLNYAAWCYDQRHKDSRIVSQVSEDRIKDMANEEEHDATNPYLGLFIKSEGNFITKTQVDDIIKAHAKCLQQKVNAREVKAIRIAIADHLDAPSLKGNGIKKRMDGGRASVFEGITAIGGK